MFKARIIPIRACMRDFACRPAARACLGAEGSGLSKACRIEARSSLGFPKHEGRGDFAVTPFSFSQE